MVEVLKEIGDGMHANIYLASKSLVFQNKVLNRQYKCIKVFKTNMDQISRNCAQNELQVSQQLQAHPNIVSIESLELQQPLTIDGEVTLRNYLSMEYCANGDLFQFMNSYGKR